MRFLTKMVMKIADRPRAITILSLLEFLIALSIFALGVIFLYGVNVGVAFFILSLPLGILVLIIAFGLWFLKKWAYFLALLGNSLLVIVGIPLLLIGITSGGYPLNSFADLIIAITNYLLWICIPFIIVPLIFIVYLRKYKDFF